MNTGFGGFMRLIFQLNSKLHFTLLMAITLYSLLLLTTYLRHLSLSYLFFFFFLQEYPTRQQKQNQTKLTRTQSQNTASKIWERERESLQKSEPSLKRFPAVSSTLSTHRSLPRYLTVPLTRHYTTLFYIFNPTLIINK